MLIMFILYSIRDTYKSVCMYAYIKTEIISMIDRSLVKNK